MLNILNELTLQKESKRKKGTMLMALNCPVVLRIKTNNYNGTFSRMICHLVYLFCFSIVSYCIQKRKRVISKANNQDVLVRVTLNT